MVKDDVKIANIWKTSEKWAKLFKLGFLPSATRMQEQAYVRMNLGCARKNKSTYVG